jgi:hypothetical protein
MLSVLDLLETNWGKWHYDQSTRKIYFNKTSAVQVYQASLAEIKHAREEQLATQDKLLNLPVQNSVPNKVP